MFKAYSKIFEKIYQPRRVSLVKDIFSHNKTISAECKFVSSSTEITQCEESGTQTSEVKHHSSFANQWWDLQGPMKGLHSLNRIRVPFIRDGLVTHSGDGKLYDNINTTKVLNSQNILEVGCGGGILTEQLARLGATVTALDLSHDLIRVAREHLENESIDILQNVTYKTIPIEVFAKDHVSCYDAVVLSEVIEHVVDKVSFLTACVQCLKPGSSLFITTINKTIPMWICGVFIAENVINLTPKGTHHWDLMISPLDLQRILDTLCCQTVILNGSIYNPFTETWSWINSTAFGYALQAIKTDL